MLHSYLRCVWLVLALASTGKLAGPDGLMSRASARSGILDVPIVGNVHPKYVTHLLAQIEFARAKIYICAFQKMVKKKKNIFTYCWLVTCILASIGYVANHFLAYRPVGE